MRSCVQLERNSEYLPELRTFRTEVVEKIETHFLCPVRFSPTLNAYRDN